MRNELDMIARAIQEEPRKHFVSNITKIAEQLISSLQSADENWSNTENKFAEITLKYNLVTKLLTNDKNHLHNAIQDLQNSILDLVDDNKANYNKKCDLWH